MQISVKARNIAEEEVLRSRLERAQRAKYRNDKIFVPRESVFAWRLGKNIQGTSKTGVHKGQWFGPAKVLGTETKKNPDGSLAPACPSLGNLGDRKRSVVEMRSTAAAKGI